MTDIAILGFGTVGAGIYDVLSRCNCGVLSDINIKYILDKRSFPDHPLGARVCTDLDIILEDPSVSVVAETLGGLEFAYSCSRKALEKGKSVVTSNKAVVDRYGEELETLAAQKGVCYLYEASVGGGIPVIHPLKTCFPSETVTRIAGILNGTTNYILTRMQTEGKSLEDALSEAQALGYAEQDPHADVAGLDAARKIAILAGIAHGTYIPFESIPHVEGIMDITSEDIRLASELGCSIKLLGVATLLPDGLDIGVAPYLVSRDCLFSAVNGCFNAVSVTGSSVGETVFYGQGAGSLPTASAVCADIARAVCGEKSSPRKPLDPSFILPDGSSDQKTVTLPNGKKYRLFD